jgi:hypothetical protein
MTLGRDSSNLAQERVKRVACEQLALANEIVERVCAMMSVRRDEVMGHQCVGRPRGSVIAVNTARALIFRSSVEARIPARLMAEAMKVSRREARRYQAAWEKRMAEYSEPSGVPRHWWLPAARSLTSGLRDRDGVKHSSEERL